MDSRPAPNGAPPGRQGLHRLLATRRKPAGASAGRRPRRFSTTAAANERLKRQGWPVVETLERILAGGRFKRDFLGKGGADVVAWSPRAGYLYVSATTRKEAAQHARDALANEKLTLLVEVGRQAFELWVWADGAEAREEEEVREYRWEELPALAGTASEQDTPKVVVVRTALTD